MQNRDYLTVREFSEVMRVHQKTVVRWIEEGKIAYWQVGNSRSIRIPISELTRHVRPNQK
jgi:excisionase family DNA binding protein